LIKIRQIDWVLALVDRWPDRQCESNWWFSFFQNIPQETTGTNKFIFGYKQCLTWLRGRNNSVTYVAIKILNLTFFDSTQVDSGTFLISMILLFLN
jgi:hypothetical protein